MVNKSNKYARNYCKIIVDSDKKLPLYLRKFGMFTRESDLHLLRMDI